MPSDFSREHLVGFDAHRENHRLDHSLSESSFQSQFISSPVEILVPSGEKKIPPKVFAVPGLLHRKLTSVISDAFSGSLAHLHHFYPFKLYHRSSHTNLDERIYGEIYTSDAFQKEHEEIQRRAPSPPEDPKCTREKVVAALMFSSDATHLTDFGNAKAWPIYLMLGNLSKYIRSKPHSGAMHHLAYIPSLPDSFQDFASEFHKKWKTQKKSILTHCRRELMQSVWKMILDDDFIHAYTYGMVIKCIDGIERRVYPRIFTYSADYPEKVLLATIRDQGLCPCPRCLVAMANLSKLGKARDSKTRLERLRTFMYTNVVKARKLIYEKANSAAGSGVDRWLKEFSGVPTMNAFVERLGKDKFNPSNMLVVDLLHEFELGVWKMLFTHLIRLLYAAGNGSDMLVVELDKR
ncbi:hypothetical protein HYPSUDRAFT_150924 [Hypholoma sublateritium FD-334 SS-4]|uniref:Uncharacterized protein n=1 Tax=Hypholoma sublateritium (strain FD-334 SS-4) TaxID=945553 RepID=A0A0D2NBP7_HYPSF|nr:hypothetical protein HYPSUDRAFT_150924 [Hypholoma sublateritium FD-334 SS-4]